MRVPLFRGRNPLDQNHLQKSARGPAWRPLESSIPNSWIESIQISEPGPRLNAGFESPSAFRVAFSKLLGRAPGLLDASPLLFADWVETPLGSMITVSSRSQLHLLEFVDRKALKAELGKMDIMVKGKIGIARTQISAQITGELDAFFKGISAQFLTPLAYRGSDFSQTVWRELRAIPAGETRSYSQIAKRIGRPSATRAVAQANGANQFALVVPCHRVIGANGSLTGYGGGI